VERGGLVDMMFNATRDKNCSNLLMLLQGGISDKNNDIHVQKLKIVIKRTVLLLKLGH
jgi:hypothetical protein